jgi:hypothetical protein
MVDCQRREKPVRRGDRRRGRLVILEAGPADRSRAHGACDCKKRRDKGQFTRILTRPALSEVAFNVVSRGTAYGPKTDVFGARSSNIVENRWGTLTLNGMLEVRGREGQQWKELTYQGKLQRTCVSSLRKPRPAAARCYPWAIQQERLRPGLSAATRTFLTAGGIDGACSFCFRTGELSSGCPVVRHSCMQFLCRPPEISKGFLGGTCRCSHECNPRATSKNCLTLTLS